MWLKKLMPKRRRKAIASTAASAIETQPFIPLAVITDVVLPQPAARQASDHLGMQGYAPRITISKNRRYCEYCAERVVGGARHVCWGNAEHHMHTLTHEERVRIMAQLEKKPRKLTRAQLRKLYSADRLGPAWIEGQRYGG